MRGKILVGALCVGAAAIGAGVAAQNEVRLRVETAAPFGQFIVDEEGKAVYLFTADKGQNASTCYDACAEAWPPVLSPGHPEGKGESLNLQKLGTVRRKDGRMQATYAGWPLYYFARDKAPGETRGQDVHGFGGEWYLIGPDGRKVEGKAEKH